MCMGWSSGGDGTGRTTKTRLGRHDTTRHSKLELCWFARSAIRHRGGSFLRYATADVHPRANWLVMIRVVLVVLVAPSIDPVGADERYKEARIAPVQVCKVCAVLLCAVFVLCCCLRGR